MEFVMKVKFPRGLCLQLMGVGKAVLALSCIALTTNTAKALTVVEDFEFYDNGPLGNNAGGSGFSGAWTLPTSGTIGVTNAVNLTLSQPVAGYEVTCIGTGAVRASNGSDDASKRALAAPITGTAAGRTVWFTTLVRPTSSGRIGWHFNVAGADRATAISGFVVVGTTGGGVFRTVTNGVLAATGPTLTLNATQLIIGSVLFKDAGASTVRYWLNPSDVTSTNALGAADLTFDVSFNNSFGAAIMNIGVEGYNDAANCRMDALRVSDGNGDPDQAFLDVTRATPKALFGPVQFGSLADLTNRFALVRAATNDWQSASDDNYGEGGFLRSSADSVNDLQHHAFLIDSDGAVGGGNDIFGDCTIEYDMRANPAFPGRMVGACFLGALRTSKHWFLNFNSGSETNLIRAYVGRDINTSSGGSIKSTMTNALNCSEWRHVRLDVRRVTTNTQVEVRNRIWNSAHDFRGPPVVDTTFTFAAGNSNTTDGEIGFTAYYKSTSTSSSADIDNVAVYRYGGAPDWYVPKGSLIRIM